MLDVRTLFVVIIASSLVLAATTVVAVRFRFRDGAGKWTGALLLQAAMYVILYLEHDTWPDAIALIVPNMFFVLSLSLQAAAILEFQARKLAPVWHAIPPLLIAVVFASLRNDPTMLVFATGVGFGAAMLALGLLLQRLGPEVNHPARLLTSAGFMLGAFALFARAIGAIVDPTLVRDLSGPTQIQGIATLTALSVILTTSVGFLLMRMERAEDFAAQLAVSDPLTGTFNRRTFLELGAKEIARTRRAKGSLALLMLDLDLFKKLNDRLGRLASDQALKDVVESLHGCLRREDLLVRYGDHVFCVLLPGIAIDQTALVAERLRAAVALAGFQFRGQQIPLTISIGLALLRRDSAEDIEQFIGRTDEALYSAKTSGGNRVVAYPENSTIALLTRSHRLAEGTQPAME